MDALMDLRVEKPNREADRPRDERLRVEAGKKLEKKGKNGRADTVAVATDGRTDGE